MPRTDFRFHLGSLALNFSATLGFRSGARVERIPTPADLGRWLAAAGLGEGLEPTESEYRAALELREAIFAAGAALGGGATPADAIGTINRHARRPLAVPQLDARSLTERFEATAPVRSALATIARDAIAVIAHRREALCRCEDPSCRALMLAQRGTTRRWCSMTTCGNRAKVAAYRARRASSDPPAVDSDRLRRLR